MLSTIFPLRINITVKTGIKMMTKWQVTESFNSLPLLSHEQVVVTKGDFMLS